jgi:predicted metal-binding membrane protein
MAAGAALGRIAGDRVAAAVLAAMLGVAALAWAVSLARMPSMGTGPGAFAGAWLAMTAAMMLPVAAPAAALRACARESRLRQARAASLFVAAWLVAGAVGYVLLRLASWQVAAIVALAIACSPGAASSVRCGGLMLAMVATGATGAGWMAAVTAALLVLRAAPIRARSVALALTVPVAVLVLASARPPESMSLAAAAQPRAATALLCTLPER